MAYLAPAFIMPLFNKFEPLEDGELKESINKMSEKCKFPLTELSVMDGSKRSKKSNAFFTGFGKNKKIALFDTLIANHSTKELVAVLAHEIGHFKKKHIIQTLVIGIANWSNLFLLGFFINSKPYRWPLESLIQKFIVLSFSLLSYLSQSVKYSQSS